MPDLVTQLLLAGEELVTVTDQDGTTETFRIVRAILTNGRMGAILTLGEDTYCIVAETGTSFEKVSGLPMYRSDEMKTAIQNGKLPEVPDQAPDRWLTEFTRQ